MEHPAYELLRPVTPSAGVVLCSNPGHMTFEGTNSWILRAPGSDACIVVDPGPGDAAHLETLAAHGRGVELILVTHRHGDHTGGIDLLHELTGAPVRAAREEHCRDAAVLTDGERIDVDGLTVDVVTTPGHTADSLSFAVDLDAGDERRRAVVTGDTVLGRATPVLDSADGDLGDYLDSLRRLVGLGARAMGLTAHGPDVENLERLVRQYISHREERLEQLLRARRELGPGASVRAIVEHVYTDVDPSLHVVAEQSTIVALRYLDRIGA